MPMKQGDFDNFVSHSDKEMRTAAVVANDAFLAAVNREIKRGKVKVTPGIYVDTSPPIGALRIRGDTLMSSCGSPAAMCVDSSGPSGNGRCGSGRVRKFAQAETEAWT